MGQPQNLLFLFGRLGMYYRDQTSINFGNRTRTSMYDMYGSSNLVEQKQKQSFLPRRTVLSEEVVSVY